MPEEIPTKEIGELLDEVATKIPKLISGIVQSLYSESTGVNMGKAVGGLYKELVEAGIPKEEALSIAKDYINTLKTAVGEVSKSASTKQ